MSDYPNLEPNHAIQSNADGDLAILCPFEIVDGHVILHDSPVTQTALWSKDASPEEPECPVCEVFNGKLHYVGSPDCVDTGDDDET